MRKSLVARLVFGLTTVAAVGVWVACGGSDAQDVVAGDAGGDASSKDGSTEDAYTPPKDSGAKDSSADTGTKERDAGTPIVIYPDGGPFAEAGIPCYEGGELEQEPNDIKALANPLRPIRCGVIEVGDAGAINDGGESDWLTFELSDASTGFWLQYEGNVKVFVETDGQAPMEATPDAAMIVRKDQSYYAQVRSADGKTQKWKVILFEDK